MDGQIKLTTYTIPMTRNRASYVKHGVIRKTGNT